MSSPSRELLLSLVPDACRRWSPSIGAVTACVLDPLKCVDEPPQEYGQAVISRPLVGDIECSNNRALWLYARRLSGTGRPDTGLDSGMSADGFVAVRKDGRNYHYTVRPDTLKELARLLNLIVDPRVRSPAAV